MHKNISDICGCFPTGLPYPGIADLLLTHARPEDLGLVYEVPRDTLVCDLPIGVIDTETTGFSFANGDRVIEIAIILFDDGAVSGRHTFLVNPGRRIPWATTKIHGITDEQVRFRPRFGEIIGEVMALLAGRIPVAYNAQFDRRFLHEEARAAGVVISKSRELAPALRSSTDWIDPLIWARYLDPGQASYKLTEIVKRKKIILKDAHQASADAEATGHLFLQFAKEMATLNYCDVVQKQRALVSQGYARPGARKKTNAKSK